MRERATRVHANRDWVGAHNHKIRLIKTHRSQTFKGLSDSEPKAAPLQSIGAVLAKDRCSVATEALARKVLGVPKPLLLH